MDVLPTTNALAVPSSVSEQSACKVVFQAISVLPMPCAPMVDALHNPLELPNNQGAMKTAIAHSDRTVKTDVATMVAKRIPNA
jgi:hypothetical protein